LKIETKTYIAEEKNSNVAEMKTSLKINHQRRSKC